MRAGQPSRTAEYMALFRAVESCRPEQVRLFSDPLAAGFLTGGLRATARAARVPALRPLIEFLIDRRAPGPRVSALARTRLIDEALAGALADGARQLVLLGAGYDSRPYRIEAAAMVRTFEVDHPSTQAAKLRRLQRLLPVLPASVAFVAIDFARQDLAAVLESAAYDAGERTFFIWEGVTNYLDGDAVDRTLRWIAGGSTPGSRLSFTYVDRGLIDGSKSFPGSQPWLRSVRDAGEPFTFGLDPVALSPYLAERGLRLLEDVSTADAMVRFPRELAGQLPPPGFYRVALAEVEVR